MDILINGMEEIPEDGAVLVVKHDNGKAYIKHARTYGYSMELVKLPAVQPDHDADVSKKAEGDCISKKMAIDALCELYEYQRDIDPTEAADLVRQGIFLAEKKIEKLPSAQPATSCSEIPNGSDDTISRQAAIDIVVFECGKCTGLTKEISKQLKQLPSAQPERKKGEWMKISPANIYECSECGKNVMTGDISEYDFCHGCGADMRGGDFNE